MSRPLPPLPAAQQTLPAPAEGGEDDETAVGGRKGASIPGGGGDDASDSDDDLEVIWEDETGAARDVDVAAGREPETTKPTGTPFRGGRSPSSPSTVVSRGGSFGGGESVPPDSSNSSSSSSSSSRSSSCNNNSSPDVDDGAGATGERAVGSGYAELPAELPKGEANRLKSWARHGEAVTSSRLRSVRSRLAETAEERGVEDATSLRALLVEILDEEMHETEVLESEQVLGGYDYDELSESLATSPMGSDIYESSYNVLSLMSSMQDTQDDEFALVVKESEGKSELESDFEWPSGPVSEAEIPPVAVAGVERSRYKGAYQWAMTKELTDLILSLIHI